MKKTLALLTCMFAVSAAHAAKLYLYVRNLSEANGDQLQYKLPGGTWTSVEPAYGLAIVQNVPNNYIVCARVYNYAWRRTISLSVKATWSGNGGDADWYGNVRFYLYGTG